MTHLTSLEIALHILAYIGLVFCCAIFLLHIAAIIYTCRRLYPKHDKSDIEERNISLPGVSIIKPLTGIDTKLKANLTSFFKMKYPRFELLFCVASEDDPACDVVRELLANNPNVSAKLLTKAHNVGVNNKINNMMQGYTVAQFDNLLISDAGIYMHEDTLLDMVLTMESDKKIGMVHQVPFLMPNDRPDFSRLFQIVYFGTWHAKMYMGAACFGINCTTGMSCMMKKVVLENGGGLKAFACYLAEDFFFSKFFYDNKWRVVISGQPAWQNAPWGTVDQFKQRITRWHQLRVAMTPLTTIFEPFTECFPNAILNAAACSYLFPTIVNWVVVFFCHVLVWFLLDYLILMQMHPKAEPLGFNRLEFFLVWFYRELTSFECQLKSFFKRDVSWRDRHYHLRWGGVAEEIRAPNKYNAVQS